MMPPRTLALFAALALAMPAKGQEITWNAEFYDPAAETGAPADLVLPMPCGGAMAFQRVDVPVDGPTPLDDRRVRLGSPQSDAGFTDYLIGTHLRGGFTDPDPTTTFFYLSRYELTADQAAALQGDCRDPSPRGRVPALGLSWFDGVALGRVYSEWLRTNAPDALPREGGAAGFVRLPTEVEWEYAARGGAALDPAAFAARTYPMPEGIDGHAWHQAVSRGGARPVGLRGANPLGLHDLYGNAEELMLEPFRANAAGRAHGQAGGLVTRGGSYLSSPEQLYSARRAEWPMFRASDGRASAAETFGARFVLSAHVAVDDARTRALDESWQNATAAAPGVEDDPLGALDEVISDETDQRRAAALHRHQRDLVVRRRVHARRCRRV
ncbi:MAG: formylglycine-generating enzyme family protein, partial [Rubricella sp.]